VPCLARSTFPKGLRRLTDRKGQPLLAAHQHEIPLHPFNAIEWGRPQGVSRQVDISRPGIPNPLFGISTFMVNNLRIDAGYLVPTHLSFNWFFLRLLANPLVSVPMAETDTKHRAAAAHRDLLRGMSREL
jgi:hypothetical protein